MDVLIRYGFSIDEIKNMMEENKEIENIDDKDIYKIIDILGSIGCLSNHIKNIFITNPFLLSITPEEIEKRIEYLKKLSLTHLEVLFDSNPYFLNIEKKELERKKKELEKLGMTNEEIKDYFYYQSDELF